jgi:hypothetical protein
MAKIFITDEGNNSYTADVTSQGLLRISNDGSGHYMCASAAQSGASAVSTSPCWLKSVIIGTTPATATHVNLYDSSGWASASGGATIFGVSGANWIGSLMIEPSAASAWASNPRIIPFNVYCASGLCVGIGDNGTKGDIRGVTIIYQA